MSLEAMNVLKKLREAKNLVERLEREYREICACNERLPGLERTHKELFSGSYTKTYKTCGYHTYKTYKAVRYASL